MWWWSHFIESTKLPLEDCMYVLAMARTIVAVGGWQFSSIILRTTPLLLRNCCCQNGGWQWGSWDGGGKWHSWSPLNSKMGQGRSCQTHHQGEEKSSLKSWELLGLESWTEENKERVLNLLAKYHDIFALEDGEMGCTEVAQHKIEVTDPKPFKERPRNIPLGLLEEVKDHLDHMLDVGAIKPSKSAWSNAVV